MIYSKKRQIYDRHGEVRDDDDSYYQVFMRFTYQEGLKQHEGGQNQPNPFDVFSNFFGGRRYHTKCPEHIH
jgi:DnaJ-related protein SCJ1